MMYVQFPGGRGGGRDFAGAIEKFTRHDKRLYFKQFDFTLGFGQDIGLSVLRFGHKFKLGCERGVK